MHYFENIPLIAVARMSPREMVYITSAQTQARPIRAINNIPCETRHGHRRSPVLSPPPTINKEVLIQDFK